MNLTQTYSVQLGPPFSAGVGVAPATLTVTALGEGRYQVTLGDPHDPAGVTEILHARKVFASFGPDPAKAATTWSLLPEGGGPQRLCDVEGSAPDLKVTVGGGETVMLKLLDEGTLLRAAGQAAATSRPSGPAQVRAPMPGKVVKLLVKLGQAVKSGQGLLIIEAMKMENELRAPADGVVTEISAAEGQTVEGGVAVVTLGHGQEPR